MTHDELLERIDNYLLPTKASGVANNFAVKVLEALRAVVELHYPYYPNFIDESLHTSNGGLCYGCMNSTDNKPPAWKDCLTIKAIEKEFR